MKFVITGGGTAGHINPALAVAQELRSLGHHVYYAGTPQGLEARLIPQEGFEYKSFEAAGFNRRKPLTLIKSSAKIARSSLRAGKWLKKLTPQAVIGFGGYVSIPVGLAASRKKIPLIIHEQNSTSGMANRFLAKRAQLLALSYVSAAKDFKTAGKVVTTGNPVRAALLAANSAEARQHFGFTQQATVLLVFGGSLGALHLNEALIANAKELMAIPQLEILHITGSRDYEMVTESLATILKLSDSGRWHILEYCDRMGDAYAAADAVLSRAGATTLAEIAALAKPALLVPYPHAAADEQTSNAKSLVERKAATMIADSDLDKPLFLAELKRLIVDNTYRKEMQHAARALGSGKAREELASLIIELVLQGK